MSKNSGGQMTMGGPPDCRLGAELVTSRHHVTKRLFQHILLPEASNRKLNRDLISEGC
jgi:hypothetical protein